MRYALLCLCLFGCRSSRSQPLSTPGSASASVSVTPVEARAPVRDAAPDATPVTLADCFEPSRVTQLRTLQSDKWVWDDDVLSDHAHDLDPETLAPVAAPARVVQDRARNELATGERVEQHGAALTAGARALPKLANGEQLESVENGRWIVLSDGVSTFHVVDGRTGKKDSRTYVAVTGDLAAWQDTATMGVTVSNLATHATVLKDAALCTAGGTWAWSLSSRYLWCTSNRGGSTGYPLRGGQPLFVGQSASISPDETYVVRVPGVGWGSDLISKDRAEWQSADTGRTVTLTKDVPPATEETPPLTSTVPIAFCGRGKLFAIVTRKELVIYRGADGKRLAAAGAMPGGDIAFSRSGRYVLDRRAGAATVYRLEP